MADIGRMDTSVPYTWKYVGGVIKKKHVLHQEIGVFLSTKKRNNAGVAQLVEHPTCNRTVVGSIPTASKLYPLI